MKFRLLHCSWDYHPEMEPEFRTNAICIEKTTRGAIFQKHLKSCSCHSDRYRQIFKEPKHPVYRGLLEDDDHLFYIPKWTSFENWVWQRLLSPCEIPWEMLWWWEPEDAAAATCRPWGWPRLAQTLPGRAGACQLHLGRKPMQHPPHQAHPAPREQVGFGVISQRAWLFAKGVTFVILPQYDSPL